MGKKSEKGRQQLGERVLDTESDVDNREDETVTFSRKNGEDEN